MSKLKLFLTAAPFALCVAGLSQASLAQEQAAPEEIVQKVTAAAGYPSEAGEPGLEKFQTRTPNTSGRTATWSSTTARRSSWPLIRE